MKDAKLNGKVVRLEGRNPDLQYLSERLDSNDFAIIRYGDHYFLKISSLDSKTQAQENSREQDVREAAKLLDSALKLVRLINGEAQLERKLFGSINGEIQFEDQVILPIQAARDVHEFREGEPVHGVAMLEARLTASQVYKLGQLSGKLSETTPTAAILAKQRKLISTHFPLELAKSDEKVRRGAHEFRLSTRLG